MSEIFTLMFAGALLIEKVFDIDGMGLLVYNSIVSRDYNVVMGIILLTSVLALLEGFFRIFCMRWWTREFHLNKETSHYAVG